MLVNFFACPGGPQWLIRPYFQGPSRIATGTPRAGAQPFQRGASNVLHHRRNFTLKMVVTSGVARIWCQGGGHDDRGAEGASIDVPRRRVWSGMGRSVPSPAD